jgi:hypothetical protein
LDRTDATASSKTWAQALDNAVTSPVTWCVFLAFGLAALVRQYLFANSYWYDEAFLVLAIRDRGFAELLGPQPYNLVIPPGFLWVLRAVYEIGGDGEIALRLPAFLAGVAALVLMIPLTRVVLGRTAALYAFAWFAVSRQLLAHGCEVRPYTFDLMFAEAIMLLAAVLLKHTGPGPWPRWALGGLAVLAIIAVWFSFPAAFVLGAVSIALALHLWRWGTWRGWLGWLIFNGLVCLSGFVMWLVSARHMYYPGMIEHWGHLGWWGFPDWHSPSNIALWLAFRPYQIGNYATRELGLVLTALMLVGIVALARSARRLGVLLCASFFLALTAALLGKFPLADRTAMFLLPCLWLLAACGLGELVQYARRYHWKLAAVGLLLVAWDCSQLAKGLIWPDDGLDYRGAYAYVQAHRQANDAIWAHMAVVYETYYGKDAPVLRDADFPQAEHLVAQQRLWAVLSIHRHDLRQRLEAGGGHVVLSHRVNGLAVLLFEPNR